MSLPISLSNLKKINSSSLLCIVPIQITFIVPQIYFTCFFVVQTRIQSSRNSWLCFLVAQSGTGPLSLFFNDNNFLKSPVNVLLCFPLGLFNASLIFHINCKRLSCLVKIKRSLVLCHIVSLCLRGTGWGRGFVGASNWALSDYFQNYIFCLCNCSVICRVLLRYFANIPFPYVIWFLANADTFTMGIAK